MTKTTKAHFKLFRDECLYWQKRFGLIGYDISFQHKDCEGSISTCKTNADGRVATITLTTDFDNTVIPLNDDAIRSTALHEMLHLLLGEVACLAISRFCQADEIDRAEEVVINILEKEFTKLRKVGK